MARGQLTVERLGDGREALRFYCVPCGGFHLAPIRLRQDEVGETYQWNGDLLKPTVVPAVVSPGCQVSIRDGRAHYHMGCSHDGRGRTMELPVHA